MAIKDICELRCQRQHALEHRLLGITDGESAILLVSCMRASQRPLVGLCENRALGWMCPWPDPAGHF